VNFPHLHLLVNHVPILGAVFALLLVLWAMRRGSRELTRLSLWVALAAGLSAWPAYFTGDEAHEQVEDYPGFDHDTTHEHEEAAELALVVMLVTAGASAVALFLGRGGRTEPGWARGAVLLGLVASTATVVRAAWEGGEIRHEEAHGSLFAPPVIPPGAAPAAHRHDDGEGEHEGAAPAAAPVVADTAPATSADSSKAAAGAEHVHKDGTKHTH
jgi:hypothetical protein